MRVPLRLAGFEKGNFSCTPWATFNRLAEHHSYLPHPSGGLKFVQLAAVAGGIGLFSDGSLNLSVWTPGFEDLMWCLRATATAVVEKIVNHQGIGRDPCIPANCIKVCNLAALLWLRLAPSPSLHSIGLSRAEAWFVPRMDRQGLFVSQHSCMSDSPIAHKSCLDTLLAKNHWQDMARPCKTILNVVGWSSKV